MSDRELFDSEKLPKYTTVIEMSEEFLNFPSKRHE